MEDIKRTLLLTLIPTLLISSAVAILLEVFAAKKRRRCTAATMAAVVKWLFPSGALLEYKHKGKVIQQKTRLGYFPVYDAEYRSADTWFRIPGRCLPEGTITFIRYNPKNPKEFVVPDDMSHLIARRHSSAVFSTIGLVHAAVVVLFIVLWLIHKTK